MTNPGEFFPGLIVVFNNKDIFGAEKKKIHEIC